MQPAIRVENLGKRYRISHDGQSHGRYKTLRDSLSALATAPLRRLRNGGGGNQEDFWALKDVSFDVKPGEVVGIIGRNGAGKSTLLKILSRITKPTTGRVELRGRVGSLLEVGTGFHPELSGRENVYLNGSILGMSRSDIARQFDAIVDFAEVEQFLDTPVKRYSSGMYVRLAFAVAAHLQPEILVVDEVLAVGDVQFQKKCLGKMGAVARQGRTVLFVSHNMTAIASLCQTAVWLDKGRVALAGDIADAVSAYLKADSTGQHERVWSVADDSTDQQPVKMRRASIRAAQNSQSLDTFTTTSALRVECEYWNRLSDAMLNVTAFLYNIKGELIFATASEPKVLGQGLIRCGFDIPGNFLNDGTYRITLMLVKDAANALVTLDDAITFDVQDLERSSGWHGKWPGAVRPRLDWQITVDTHVPDVAGHHQLLEGKPA